MSTTCDHKTCDPTSGQDMLDLITDLFPMHRAILGDGLRNSLRRLEREIPLTILEVPTATHVFDWVVPEEWRIRDAFIEDQSGKRIVDYRNSNLHVVNFSSPVDAILSWTELASHLHTDPARPNWIPYRTNFFRKEWGFCLPHNQWLELAKRPHLKFKVRIDAERFAGSMSIGEFMLPATTQPTRVANDMLFYAHTCHPSLANDNLSGIAVATHLAKRLAQRTHRRWNYRFVFAPATIGCITWLAIRQRELSNIRAGLVLSLLGDDQSFSYKRSNGQNSYIDYVINHWMRHRGLTDRIHPFTPWGYDERQFNSPGFNLPIGRLTRSLPGDFPEYHTSADNLDRLSATALEESLQACLEIVDILEADQTYRNLFPFGEPQLGDRGLYRAYGESEHRGDLQQAILWILNQSDGHRSLLNIAERADLPFRLIQEAVSRLIAAGLVEPTLGGSEMRSDTNALGHPADRRHSSLIPPTRPVEILRNA